MKKCVCLLTFVVLFFTQAVFAGDFSSITKNPKLTQSLEALEKVNKREVLSILNGNNKTGKPIRVMFRELEIYGLSKCEAVTMRTKDGGLVIFINKKHETAPVDAIACLIAHESQHHPMAGTAVEEVRAWIMEISTWNTFVRDNKAVAGVECPLTKRLNYISRLYNTQGQERIEGIISKNPMYKDLN